MYRYGGDMKIVLTFLMIIFCMGLSTSAYGATFKGKVIDADTKEPIEGAVVVASWMEETTTPGATHTRLKDVKESITDKKGEWIITGPKGKEGGNITSIFTLITGTYYTRTPEFIVFKPGYCSWPAGFTIDACRGKIKPAGNNKVAEGDTVELPRLTDKDARQKAARVGPSSMSDILADKEKAKKVRNFITLINEEKRFLGLPEYPILKEIRNEK
jgi:hypothetical protein